MGLKLFYKSQTLKNNKIKFSIIKNQNNENQTLYKKIYEIR